MKFYVGAYASSPNVSGWDSKLESQYFDELKKLPNMIGLEHPFFGSLHPHSDEWFLGNIDPNWRIVLTCIPGVMGALGENPNFGIASDDDAGRKQAVDFMRDACDAINKINSHAKKQVVRAIQIQTAPKRSTASGSKESLLKSLETMLTWDWQGAQLVIEHCDAYIESQQPSKGFLSLEDEIEVVRNINQNTSHNMGILVNWGRSVIETRRASGAIEHIKLLKQHQLLSGLMFSGVSDQDTEYGEWQDTHMPPAPSVNIQHGAEKSLLTEEELKKSLKASDICARDDDPILGIKIGIRPRSSNLQERVAYIKDALNIISLYCDEQ